MSKYRKEEGLIYGTECLVFANEFVEDVVLDFYLNVVMLFMYLAHTHTHTHTHTHIYIYIYIPS